MNRSRRPWLLAGVLAVVAAVGSSPVVTGPASGDASVVSVPARPASDLVDSIGVGVHLGFRDTPYVRTDAVVAALDDLGVHHVRDEWRLDQPEQRRALQQLARAGISSSLVVGPRPDQARDPGSAGTAEQNVEAVADELAGHVDHLEGLNEPDLWLPRGWVAWTQRWQRSLYAAAKAEPRLADVPVLAPSTARRDTWAGGDAPDASDRANAHLYPDGEQPGGVLADKLAEFERAHPGQRIVLTETGYHNTTGRPTQHPAVPERVAATYLPRLLVETFEAGVERTYVYELLDQFADPQRTHRESNFGLLRHDLSPKPAYLALRELVRVVEGPAATAGATSASARLALGVTGREDVEHLALRRRDGSFVVLLWRDVSVWDTTLLRPVPVVPATVTLHLGAPSAWAVRSVGASRARTDAGTGQEVTVPVGGDLVAVTLSPAG